MQFFVIYIREAHAIDSPSPLIGEGMPIIEDPDSLEERGHVAASCMTRLALDPMPALVDTVQDTVNQAYGAWPDRLYLIGKDGRIAFRGRPGPHGFLPDELEAAIRREVGHHSD